ncbi:MAG: PqqD family protein [Bacteriovoracaceae bacterium]|nr:PqqD family protein [Bacteriovoracaceae bacterium]
MTDKKYDKSTIFEKRNDVVSRANNDENVTVLMKMDDSSSFYKIDGVAQHVWGLINEHKSVDEMLRILESKYDASAEKISEDVHKFLHKLLDLNIIEF